MDIVPRTETYKAVKARKPAASNATASTAVSKGAHPALKVSSAFPLNGRKGIANGGTHGEGGGDGDETEDEAVAVGLNMSEVMDLDAEDAEAQLKAESQAQGREIGAEDVIMS